MLHGKLVVHIPGFSLDLLGCKVVSVTLGPDELGCPNVLFISLLASAASTLVIWPVSNNLGPLIAFVMINGAANGVFFATLPTVVGTVFGSARASVATGMIVTGWAGGYVMV